MDNNLNGEAINTHTLLQQVAASTAPHDPVIKQAIIYLLHREAAREQQSLKKMDAALDRMEELYKNRHTWEVKYNGNT